MHDGETIDLFAPFGAFPGAATSHKNHPIRAVDKKGETCSTSGGGVEPQQLANIGLNGDGDNDIADNVDGFLDDFLALVDSGSGGGGIDELMDAGGNGGGGGGNGDVDIAEEDLFWLEDMDLAAFLPPPADPDALAGANGPLPSSVHEIEPMPEPAVLEEGAAAMAAPVVAGGGSGGGAMASQTAGCITGSSVRAGGDVSEAVGNSAAAGASPSPAGLSAAATAVSSAAPVVAGGGGAGRKNNDGGGAATYEGGGVDGAGISRKEQLRRQKVARYLAKKKSRRWSKATASSYQSRQRVANTRPRHKGRFLPLESDFVPIAELQRRQRAVMKQMQEKAAAAAGTAAASTDAPFGGAPLPLATSGAAAASGNVSPPSLELGNQVAI